MAKDTSKTGKDSSGQEFDRTKSEVVKKGLEKNAQRADEIIVAQSKDASNASIQAGNAARMEGLPSAGSVPKNPNVEPLDNLTPKVPSPSDPTPRQEATTAARRPTTGRRTSSKGTGKGTGNLDFGNLPKKAQSPFNTPEAVDNRLDRLQSGMGLPGSENGDLDLAIKLHARDLAEAKSSGKVVNGVNPTDSPKTSHIQVSTSPHHTAFARVMRVMGIADEEVYKRSASAAGQRLENHIAGLHVKVQQHEDSKIMIPMVPKKNESWQHPKTKEIIPISANHPDMPSAFMRTKGLINKVTRDAEGAEIRTSGHNGWTRAEMSTGRSVLHLTSAPTKGVDLIDHLRVQMLDEHGPSSTSRKKGADIANNIADVVSGSVPRGMKRAGQRKVAAEGFGKEKYEDTYLPAVPVPTTRAFDKPKPPSAKSGTVLLGSKPPADLPDFKAKGPKMTQLVLPGTGEPKRIAVEKSPEERSLMQGPLTQDKMSRIDMNVPVPVPPKDTAAEQILEQGEPPTYNAAAARKKREESRSKAVYGDTGKGGREEKKNENVYGGFSTLKIDRKKGTLTRGETRIPIENEQDVRSVVTKPAEYTSEVIPTNRDWKPQGNPNRGQQFAIDTTDMTGAGEVSALKSAGALVPSGKKTKKTKPMVQPSLFPDYSVKESRKNAFETAGSVVPISEASKTLQGAAKQPFGKQPNNKDYEAENTSSLVERTKVGSAEEVITKFRNLKN